jgi:hypothetical protein
MTIEQFDEREAAAAAKLSAACEHVVSEPHGVCVFCGALQPSDADQPWEPPVRRKRSFGPRCGAAFAGESCGYEQGHPGPHWTITRSGEETWTEESAALTLLATQVRRVADCIDSLAEGKTDAGVALLVGLVNGFLDAQAAMLAQLVGADRAELRGVNDAACDLRPAGVPADVACPFRKGHACPCRFFGSFEGGS